MTHSSASQKTQPPISRRRRLAGVDVVFGLVLLASATACGDGVTSPPGAFGFQPLDCGAEVPAVVLASLADGAEVQYAVRSPSGAIDAFSERIDEALPELIKELVAADEEAYATVGLVFDERGGEMFVSHVPGTPFESQISDVLDEAARDLDVTIFACTS